MTNHEPCAWMFTNPKNGNIVFFARAIEAENFREWNPDWEMTTLYAKEDDE
jgi:hypothetical protein